MVDQPDKSATVLHRLSRRAIGNEAGPSEIDMVWTEDAAMRFADLVLARLVNAGVPIPRPNRLLQARGLIADQQAAGSHFPAGTSEARARAWLEANRSIAESYIITSALDDSSPQLTRRLGCLLEGAEEASADSNHLARNTQFELLIAALLRLGGFREVRMEEPDIQVRVGSTTFGVAAKRVQSHKKIFENATKAAKQLEAAKLDGFIALNLDVIAENVALSIGTEAVPEATRAIVDSVMDYVARRDEGVHIAGCVGFAMTFLLTEGQPELALRVTCPIHLRAPRSEAEWAKRGAMAVGERIRTGLSRLFL